MIESDANKSVGGITRQRSGTRHSSLAGGTDVLLWRNWLARSAVNRKVGGSSPPRSVFFFFSQNLLSSRSVLPCVNPCVRADDGLSGRADNGSALI